MHCKYKIDWAKNDRTFIEILEEYMIMAKIIKTQDGMEEQAFKVAHDELEVTFIKKKTRIKSQVVFEI